MHAQYVHTNLIAKDWRTLADFYVRVFGCTFVPPERDYTGDTLDRGTALKNAHLTGAHFRLPGNGAEGPTLEIYSYDELQEQLPPAVNRPGFGHLAFLVDDVENARQEVLANGGRAIGEIVTVTTSAGTRITWCYVTDPEGNMLELQTVDERQT